MLTLIAAVASNNIIGNKGKMPWDIPAERQIFKNLTMGHPIIMGRITHESIGHDLPGRQNIVLSHTGPYNSIEKVLEEVRGKDAFVVGGGQVYAQMMPMTDEMRISHLKSAYDGDVFFPKINPTVWKIAEKQDYSLFTHIRYIRV